MSEDTLIISYNTLYQKKEIIEEYISSAEELLKSSGWNPEPLKIPYSFCLMQFEQQGLFIKIIGIGQEKYDPAFRRTYISQEYNSKGLQTIILFNFLDIVMLPHMLGLWDMTLSLDSVAGRLDVFKCRNLELSNYYERLD